MKQKKFLNKIQKLLIKYSKKKKNIEQFKK